MYCTRGEGRYDSDRNINLDYLEGSTLLFLSIIKLSTLTPKQKPKLSTFFLVSHSEEATSNSAYILSAKRKT
jgi:hypothetical protein